MLKCKKQYLELGTRQESYADSTDIGVLPSLATCSCSYSCSWTDRPRPSEKREAQRTKHALSSLAVITVCERGRSRATAGRNGSIDERDVLHAHPQRDVMHASGVPVDERD